MIVWRDTKCAGIIREHYNCGLMQTASDDARLVAYNFHPHLIGFERDRKYYIHGPAGVTDWLGSEEEAKAAYERMVKPSRRSR